MKYIMLTIILKLCYGFTVGVCLYFCILNGSLGIYIQNRLSVIQRLSFLELFLILFLVYCLITFLTQFVLDSIIGDYSIIKSESIWNMAIQGDGKSSSSENNVINSASNGAIMTAAVAGGSKLAQKVPHVAGKLAVATGSVVIGAAAIAAKNISGNITANLGKPKYISDFISSDSIPSMSDFFNLSGNSVTDLLTLIQFFQSSQMIFIFLIGYYLMLLTINESKLENFLIKLFPIKLVSYFMISVVLFKKTGVILIICLTILLIISTYLASYYLDFFVNNLDEIIELYLKNKK